MATMVKGTVKPDAPNTNVRLMATSEIVAALKWDPALQKGDIVYGELNPTGTDIVNFTKFYRADGSIFPLPGPCKAVVNYLIVTNETEPETPPSPGPGPTPEPAPPPNRTVTLILVDDDTGTVETWKGTVTRQ